jgi:hypothetical protein
MGLHFSKGKEKLLKICKDRDSAEKMIPDKNDGPKRVGKGQKEIL